MSTHASLRDQLRSIPVFSGQLPTFDPDDAPAAPLPLLISWLEEAIEAGVSQPHAMTLATASATGEPSARTLLLKDVDGGAVWFASMSTGPKGRDIDENPRVALTMYWREQGRQVRIVGDAEEGPRDVSEADFLARSPGARASAVAGRQSEPIAPTEIVEELVADARTLIAVEPDFVPAGWTAYRVVPTSVEFWQADRERDQIRLHFARVNDAWERQILWP